VLSALFLRGMWAVDELAAPRVPIIFFANFPAAPPLFEARNGGRPASVASSTNEHRQRPARPRSEVVPVIIPPASSLIGEKGGPGEPTGDGHDLGQGCPGGPGSCSGEAPALNILPPHVGEKSCVSCPMPQLPPAFLRVGMAQSILARICVGADGNVSSIKILTGVSEVADAGVAETLRQWRFAPPEIDGRPVPFCYVSRFEFRTQ
jgi:hypothetical protein